jgi:hypothetical protein
MDAGLHVSLATVKREAARPFTRPPHADKSSVLTPAVPLRAPLIPSLTPSAAFANDPRSAKEIAAEFVRSRITNPLLRSRNAS